MRAYSKLVGSVTAAALLMVSAAPAQAGWRRPPPRHYHHDRDNSGAVIGAVAVVGLIGLLAAASSAKRKERAARDRAAGGRDYDGQVRDERVDGPRDVGSPSWDAPQDGAGAGEQRRAAIGSREEAVDACALAARDEGTRLGGYAEMRDVKGSTERRNGWDVSGTIVQRASYGAVGQLRDFRCAFEDGRVQDVALS